MSESERVQRWRQRQRASGKEPLTIWLTAEEKLRLEDMALTRRCSPSELVQHALALWRGESPPVTVTVTDTVTVTVQQMLPALVRTFLQEQQAGIVSATVTDTVADTSPVPRADRIPEPAPEPVTDTVSAMVVLPMTYPVTVATTDAVVLPMTAPVTDTTTSPTAQRKAPARRHAVTDTVSDTVSVTDSTLEPFDTAKYVLGKLCPRGHAWGSTGQSLLRRTNRHCCACDREKFQERGKVQRQTRRQQQRQQEGQG